MFRASHGRRYTPGMRALRRILITIVVLAGLYVAADFGARAAAETQVAASLQASLVLSKKPDVSLGGFPFLPRAVDGHLDKVVLAGANLSAGGQPLQGVRLTLRDVEFSATDLVFGRDTVVRFRSSDGTAAMTGADLTAAMARANIDARVRLEGGLAHVSVAGFPEVRVEVTLDDNHLVLRPTDLPLPLRLRLDLSDLVPDIRCREGHVERSLLHISFTLARTRFDIR
jgi:hypothetical protein